jgi:hypothetical protein
MTKGIDVVSPEENFRGLSYGYWAAIWCNWLMSEDPDNYNVDSMLFLRGNVDYRPVGNVNGAPRNIDHEAHYDRTGNKGEKIFDGTAIFFPVINALYCMGNVYEGVELKKEEDLRFAARKDINEGGKMRAEIIKKGENKGSKIVKSLKDYLIESPLFKLEVSNKSALRDRTENELKPGIYNCITVGYYILIKALPPSNYRIHFEAKGRGIYYTNAIYDITVQDKRRDSVEDISCSQKTLKSK